jgi:uncharacterized protein (DUF2342 family)
MAARAISVAQVFSVLWCEDELVEGQSSARIVGYRLFLLAAGAHNRRFSAAPWLVSAVRAVRAMLLVVGLGIAGAPAFVSWRSKHREEPAAFEDATATELKRPHD